MTRLRSILRTAAIAPCALALYVVFLAWLFVLFLAELPTKRGWRPGRWR
jgi:hypothetical protein